MSKNDGERDSLFLVLILPSLHLLLCIWTDAVIGEDGFKWYLVGLIDFPVFILVAALPVALSPFLEYTVLGTLWWFSVGALFKLLYRRFVSA